MLRFLDEELGASNADWKIVVGHHPAYSGGRHEGSSTIRDEVMPILIDHNVDFYIMGHDHNLQVTISEKFHDFEFSPKNNNVLTLYLKHKLHPHVSFTKYNANKKIK